MTTAQLERTESVEDVLHAFAAWCASFEPATVPPGDVEVVFRSLAALSRLVDGAITRLTPRFERSGAWRDAGDITVADALARQCGTSLADAHRRVDTARHVERTPALTAALAEGRLSRPQTEVLSSAADSADLEALVLAAGTQPLADLRRTVADTHSSEAVAERNRRVHRGRSLRRWTDADGSWHLHLRCLPEWGAAIDARLKATIDAAFTTARKAGHTEPVAAYGADALYEVICGSVPCNGGPPGTPRRSAVRPDRKVIAVVDVSALRTAPSPSDDLSAPTPLGDGSLAHIAGVGPVPASTARALLGDAALALVIRDGVDVLNVTHLGRAVSAHQRTALEARGYRCEIEGCGRSHHLEIDHVTGWALTRTTELADLAWLCTHHHGEKTRRGLALEGPPGRRRLLRPPP